MADIYPVLTETQLEGLASSAEAQIYRLLRDDLKGSYVVLHGQSFVAPMREGGHRDGEADFVVFSENHGILTIEVKGGGVRYDPASGWWSTDRKDQARKIKDPALQAKNEKFAIFNEFQAHHSWISLKRRIVLAHSVMFPDVDLDDRLSLPECPRDIVGGKSELYDISAWVEHVFNFWRGPKDANLGRDGLEIVRNLFCRPVEVKPLLRDILADQDKRRIQLTHEQANVLRMLGRHKRAAIAGAAGTGKTVLAIEKAKMLAASGLRTLLLCYNKPLGVTLAQQFADQENVTACTYHQFCQLCCKQALDGHGIDVFGKAKAEAPGEDEWASQRPLAAYYAIEECGDELRYDAVIVDEGQDFGEEYWLPLEMTLKEPSESWLYIFFDENQRFYHKASTFPIKDAEIYSLTKNCRNTKPVHSLAYRYYQGEAIDDSGLEGDEPIYLPCASDSNQAKQIARHITKLVHDEKVSPSDIGVLVSAQSKDDCYQLLEGKPLPKPAQWSVEEHFVENGVVVDTIKRFKGLERDIVFLWLDHQAATDNALMYVGISRAKSLLYIVGAQESLSLIYEEREQL